MKSERPVGVLEDEVEGGREKEEAGKQIRDDLLSAKHN